MSRWPTGEIVAGIWRFEHRHPEWTPADDDWPPEVASWAIASDDGLVLVDPFDGDAESVRRDRPGAGELAAVIRTCKWHQRRCAEVAARHRVDLWALPAPGEPRLPYDRAVEPGRPLPGGLVALATSRFDELALWSPPHRALLVADVIVRGEDGTATLCPEGWLASPGGPDAVRRALAPALEWPVEHLLVSHGAPVTGNGLDALRGALAP